MKRDIDLIKQILIEIEKSKKVKGWIKIDIPNRSLEEISYHIKLLYQAGLIEAVNQTTKTEFEWTAKSLTWQGHEFLDAIRNDTVWKKLKAKIKEQGGSIPFHVVKELAAVFSKDLLA
jgi:exonuclease V gamma subunit